MKIGIVGGMGARAGAHFFEAIIDHSPAYCDQEYPEIIVHSNPKIPDRTTAILKNGPSCLPELLRSVNLLENCGVDILLMACITSYNYFELLSKHTTAYFPSPFDLLRRHLQQYFPFATKVGVLASTGAIKSGLFHRGLAGLDIEVVTLSDQTQEEKFMDCLYGAGGVKSLNISQEALEKFRCSVGELEESGVDVVLGGCSEVPVLTERVELNVHYVDMMGILITDSINKYYKRQAV